MATRGILRELAAAYEKACGRSVTIESVGGVDAAHRVRAREPFDVVLLASDVLARLATERYVLSGSRVSFARSSMAIAVGEGAVRIPIGNEAAVRQASLNARAIGYSTGPSGDHLLRLWDRWGIREDVMQRAIRAVPGQSVASLLATGHVELGFQQLSELLHQPGIRILGPMPMEIEKTTIFAAGSLSAHGDDVKPATSSVSWHRLKQRQQRIYTAWSLADLAHKLSENVFSA